MLPANPRHRTGFELARSDEVPQPPAPASVSVVLAVAWSEPDTLAALAVEAPVRPGSVQPQPQVAPPSTPRPGSLQPQSGVASL